MLDIIYPETFKYYYIYVYIKIFYNYYYISTVTEAFKAFYLTIFKKNNLQ